MFVQFSRVHVAVVCALAFFLIGVGTANRWNEIEDAPSVHRNHESRLARVEAWICDHEGISNASCRRWLETTLSASMDRED